MNIALENFKTVIFENSVYSHSNKILEKTLPSVQREDVVRYYNNILDAKNEGQTYLICSENITVQEVLDIFYNNRKMQALIITKHGTEAERAINILTNADFFDLNKIIDDYNI